MPFFDILKYFNKKHKKSLLYVPFLSVFLIFNEVNCTNKIGGTSRSIKSGSVLDNHDHGVSSGIISDISENPNSKNSKHYSSSLSSSVGTDGGNSESGFSPYYYSGSMDYPQSHYSPSTVSTLLSSTGQLPQHLEYYTSQSHPYKYYIPSSETQNFKRRQLRYSSMPEFISEPPIPIASANSFDGIATGHEKDSSPSSSSYYSSYEDYGGHGGSHPEVIAPPLKSGYRYRIKKSKGKGWKGKKHTTHTSHTDYKVSAVNTDGIGLLGLLGLLSLFQFALLALTTTTAAAGRKKRSFDEDTVEIDSSGKMVDNLSQIVLPSLNVVAHARNGKIPLNCTYLEVCRTNQLIMKNMEFGGSIAGIQISEAIVKMLEPLDKSSNKSFAKQLKEASLRGRMGETCEKNYPICNNLKKNGVYSLPLLLPLTHPYYYNNADKIRSNSNEKQQPAQQANRKHL